MRKKRERGGDMKSEMLAFAVVGIFLLLILALVADQYVPQIAALFGGSEGSQNPSGQQSPHVSVENKTVTVGISYVRK